MCRARLPRSTPAGGFLKGLMGRFEELDVAQDLGGLGASAKPLANPNGQFTHASKFGKGPRLKCAEEHEWFLQNGGDNPLNAPLIWNRHHTLSSGKWRGVVPGLGQPVEKSPRGKKRLRLTASQKRSSLGKILERHPRRCSSGWAGIGPREETDSRAEIETVEDDMPPRR